jgi:mono/diheme cytochrome c family protein
VRHQYSIRLVIAMTALLVIASALFAVGALQGVGTPDRVDAILAIAPDLSRGRVLYTDQTDPPCAACHTLAAADAFSERASSLMTCGPPGERWSCPSSEARSAPTRRGTTG